MPAAFAAPNRRSMLPTVPCSVTLSPTTPPGHAIFRQEIDLRIGHHKRGALLVDGHVHLRQSGIRRIGIGRTGGFRGGTGCVSASGNGGGRTRSARHQAPAHQIHPFWGDVTAAEATVVVVSVHILAPYSGM
ncbi:hypothetical protein [Meridianimarinicoccus roseus]|uniref:hypothetical protein n=1 Tax=Meridianimarinicoccus roseus TaxID=2072018 RepID=UPI001EE66BF8|nr:hypothetical protein [Meridianimarinicoccus roseus]